MRSPAATFAFVSEAGARLACSLDGAPFSSCASPKSYAGLPDGKHVFAVARSIRRGTPDAP